MHSGDSSGDRSLAAGELSALAERLHAMCLCCGAHVRLEILGHLACEPMTVGELAEMLELDSPLVSKYLKTLGASGIVEMRKSKKLHIFSLCPAVGVRWLDDLLELRFPVEEGLSLAFTLTRRVLCRMHPSMQSASATTSRDLDSSTQRVMTDDHSPTSLPSDQRPPLIVIPLGKSPVQRPGDR
jgi:DNA-binding transcriptional ArsR family regulator